MTKAYGSYATRCYEPDFYRSERWQDTDVCAAVRRGARMLAHKLLLVEDSAAMREAIREVLGEECGSIHWVDDGAKVLSKAAEIKPDTILLDISLPGISGLILLPLLRQAHPGTTIVMLTNHAEEVYRRQALARGADSYVLKSRANAELLPAIVAGRSPMATSNA